MRARRHTLVWILMVLACVLSVNGAAGAAGAASAQSYADYNYYFGNLHSHTSCSDGMLTPSDAFVHARDAGMMDFLAVTDHGYYLQDATNIRDWYKSLVEADEFYEPGRFASLIGFEWTYGPGHMNGHQTPLAASRDTQRDLEAYTEFLARYDGFGVFNHPNYNIQPNWDDFEYYGERDKYIALLEVGSGPYRHNVTNEPAYIRALDRGWRVGAIDCQDNHRADWGTAAPTRTGILAPELTREALYGAMRAMRTYATEDRNVRVFFAAGDVVMGGEIVMSPERISAGDTVKFTVIVDDPDSSDMLEWAALVTNGGRVLQELAPKASGRVELEFEVLPEQAYNWYYVRARQSDSDLIVTSPIWVTTGSGITVTDLGTGDRVPRLGAPVRVSAEIVNRNDTPVPKASLTLYSASGGSRTPVASGAFELPAGRGVVASLDWTPAEVGDVRLELEVSIPGYGGLGDVFVSDALRVRGANVAKVIIDEGHNNRYSGYQSSLSALLRTEDFSPTFGDSRVTAELLANSDVLVINVPEIGFSLTPTSFEEDELDAIVKFAERGGSLLLAGWSASDDESRTLEQLNMVLERIGSSIRFASDEIRTDGSYVITVDWDGGAVYALEACSLVSSDGGAVSDSSAVRVLARAAHALSADPLDQGVPSPYASAPVFAVAESIGRCRVVVLGSPIYHNRDLARPGFSNAEFTLSIMRWLAGGESMYK